MPQYQGVWTLEQQAQAQSNQQWVTDPNFKNTTLLLQADGTGSGSQNQTFLDGSTNNFFITRNGNTTQGSFSPFSQAPGYWGNYFAAAADFISIPDSTNVQLGSGDFTLEFWTYLTATFSTQWITGKGDAATGAGTMISFYGTLLQIWSGGTNYDITIPASTWPLSTWLHVAVVRNGTSANNLTLYVNGRVIGSASIGSNTINTGGSNPLKIGSYAGTGPICYISNYRLVKGTALYTSAFTPPSSPLTAVTNTTLLTCQSNRFIDNSTAAATVTASGTPSVQAFGPFAPTLQWTPDVVGGSGYFDGSGDYLSIPSSSNLSLGTGDFTLECWVYPLSWNSSTDQNLFAGNAIYSPGLGGNLYYPGKLVFGYNGVVTIVDNATLPAVNTWTHVVATRASGVFRIFLNGTQSGSTVTYSADFSAPIVFVGTNGGTGFVNGYISGARVIKGTALYTSNFTPPTAPPTAVSGTQLLLNMTNAGIYDGKMANNLETVGNAQVSTSVVKYGSGSMYFNGSSYLRGAAANVSTQMGTGAFTWECWCYITSATGFQGFIDTRAAPSSGSTTGMGLLLFLNTYTPIATTNDTILTSSISVTPSAWTHVALTRTASGILTIWVNGVSGGSVSNSTNLTDNALWIGGNNTSPYPAYVNGFIDDLRITKGLCRYFTTFTPPQQALPRQ